MSTGRVPAEIERNHLIPFGYSEFS